MHVLMLPTLESQKRHESGIKRVIEAYHRYASDFGIKFVPPSYPEPALRVIHAGTTGDRCDVAMLHGLYWTADYHASEAEWHTNARIVATLRHAKEITVPSDWVAETIRRDLRVNPHIIPHGIEWDEWQHHADCEHYVLWNKNRASVDVCDPAPVGELARRFEDTRFLTTFAPGDAPPNVKATGLVPHAEMKEMVQRAGVYLSTTKETFGIGVLEALAAGVPVLGWAYGGNLDLVEHGVSGYLARPGDYDDLATGLGYCIKHRKALGANGRECARAWTWPAAMEKLASVFKAALAEEAPTVGVVIPVYNKTEREIRRAIESVINQSYQPAAITIIDDGSDNEAVIKIVVDSYRRRSDIIHYIRQQNSGVAIARNRGIDSTDHTKYVCCLDSDDWLEPDFLKVCVGALERDRSLGIAYTGMTWHRPDGSQGVGRWPGQADPDKQAKRHNQVPTCCVFRRKVWQRLGGYRQRYAPRGAGAEDAELWLRMMAYGWRAEEITPSPLFNYSWLSGEVSGNRDYTEVDWTAWHPWTGDGQYPLTAVMRPAGGKASHPVRQYDEPLVSVIIPVGPGHEQLVIDALDSLEAQTFRRWEVIVVWDNKGEPPDTLKDAYPYIKWAISLGNKSKGAGWARNRGAEIARAPFILWLDADDWLQPTALAKMLRAWNEGQGVVYTDYIKIIDNVEPEQVERQRGVRKIIEYDEAKQRVAATFRAYDFDCERAMRQPEEPVPYYWCLSTTLVPRAWHEEIGGYDESMVSWEDADYAFRLVQAGHCYVRVPDELVVVRAGTGQRMEQGRQNAQNLVQYMKGKYREKPMAGCSGCGGRKVAVSRSIAAKPGTNRRAVTEIDDEDMIRVRYMDGNRGNHPVYGSTINPLTGKKFFYGYHGGGAELLVHRNDVYMTDRRGRVVLRDPGKFMPIQEQMTIAAPAAPVQAPPPPPEPAQADEPIPSQPFNFQTIPGVNKSIADQFKALGLESAADVLALGEDGLQEIKGIGEAKARSITSYLRQYKR